MRPVATRGAGAPPSLRHFRDRLIEMLAYNNEGRRRPSLIAAPVPQLRAAAREGQRGAPAPLPHCGGFRFGEGAYGGAQRGAPAPLPHCGSWLIGGGISQKKQRGAPAPLPHCGVDMSAQFEVRHAQRGAPAPLPHCGFPSTGVAQKCAPSTRGAGAPPSLRRAPPPPPSPSA